MEAHVLEQHERALGRRLDRRADTVADALVELDDRHAEQLGQAHAHDVDAQVLDHLALGPTQVHQADRAPTRVQDRTQGGQGRADARVIGDLPRAIAGHVEVDAAEDPLAGQLEVGQGRDREAHLAPTVLPAAVFLAAVFLAAVFLAAGFIAAGFFAVDFFAVGLRRCASFISSTTRFE